MKKNIKFFPIVLAIIATGAGFKYVLDKRHSVSGSITITFNSDGDMIVSFDGPNAPSTSTIFKATTNTTYDTDLTSETTFTTTTENIYKDIMFLNNINYSMEDINGMIVKYSSYSDISYDVAVSILHDNFDNINKYNSLEDFIMRSLFDGALEADLLSKFCDDENKKTKSMSRDEQESIIINMCDIMGISNDDKKIILAIFRWETDHGTSYLCVNNNNYGGVKVGDNFCIYQTPEFGMYEAIKCVYGHITTSKNNGCTDINSIICDMSYRYCFNTAAEWAKSINGMIYGVSEYYSDFENTEKKYEG